MSLWEVILIGAALAMDACAVSMTDGMTNKKCRRGKRLQSAERSVFFNF